jgi:serine/threonine-protein kinase
MSDSYTTVPPPSMPFPPGSILAGKYRVEKLLGEGGMGWVVVATHLQLEQRVALKFMHAVHSAEHPDAVARFIREARAAARIHSEHVARVSDVGTLDNGAPYLVMEYLEGQDLEALLQSRRPIPLVLAVEYAMQACEGLAEAHAAGIVHRDLKPANLFLARRSDGTVRVKLLDFGISKLAPLMGGTPDVGMTSTQALMGSPLYMSPEQLRSSKNVDRRADIWSMGVILYEMFGGRSPFEADTLPEVCARIMAEPPATLGSIKPELPPALDGVIMRCLEKDPARRFPEVASLAQALAPFGPPDARAAAERIARLSRASAPAGPASVEINPDASGPVLPVAGGAHPPVGVAQTNASFSTGKRVLPRRSPLVPIAIGSALVGIVAVVAVMAIRGRGTVAAIAPAGTAATSATTSAAAGTGTATATANPNPPPTETATATATATATPTAAGTPTAPATGAAPPRFTPRGKPPATATAAATAPATAAATTTAKPSGTTGFGGRD